MHTDGEFGAAPFLIENIGLLPKGRALDIAMGSGRNTIYLAKMGFDAEGIDISEEAVKTALERAEASGAKIDARVADIETEDYLIDKDAYDVIICFNYLHRPLVRQIRDGLKKGGVVVYQTYTVDQLQFGKPCNTDFLLGYNELLEMFRSFRCLRYHEEIMDHRKAVAGIIARKV